VIDFGKKIWLLLLLHEAMKNDYVATESNAVKNKCAGRFGDDAKPYHWFKKSLFEAKWENTLWRGPRPTDVFPGSDNAPFSYYHVIAAFDKSQESVANNANMLVGLLMHSRVNYRFGFRLEVYGEHADDPNATSTDANEGFVNDRLANKLRENEFVQNFCKDTSVSMRLLARLAAGFFMLSPKEGNEAAVSPHPLTWAQRLHPKNFDFYTRNFENAPQDNAWTNHDADTEIERKLHARAARVFQSFCGSQAKETDRFNSSMTGIVYGQPIDVFKEAVTQYYLTDINDIVLYPSPPLFRKLQPRPVENATKVLEADRYEVTGSQPENNPYGTNLRAVFDKLGGTFHVAGGFAPPRGDPHMNFTQIKIKCAATIDQDNVTCHDLSEEAISKLPNGFRFQGNATLRLKFDSTESIDDALNKPVHMMTILGATNPFSVGYAVTAPLESLIPEVNVGGNQGPTGAKAIVAAYLKSIMAPEQADFTPPSIVDIVSGHFIIDDPNNNYRGE